MNNEVTRSTYFPQLMGEFPEAVSYVYIACKGTREPESYLLLPISPPHSETWGSERRHTAGWTS